MTRISIHQPNFFPWIPFFQKVQESDVFVLLKHAQYEKGGYQNRFNILDNWYTMSVESGMVDIIEKNYLRPSRDFDTIKRRLPRFKSVLSLFDRDITYSMSVTNSNIINRAASLMNIRTPIYSDYKTELKSTARLIAICKMYGAKEYLSGISGAKYLDLQLFKAHGIKLVFQDETKMDKHPLIYKLNDIL